MRVAVLYYSNSEQERTVLEFEHDYEHVTGRKLTLYDLNTIEGTEMASLYDVVQYPAVLAISNDGQMLKLWQGEILPLMNEVMYYDQPD